MAVWSSVVTHSYRLTEKELWVLSIVSRDGDALLFDLEVQELAARALIDDHDGYLSLTERGRRALQAAGMKQGPEEVPHSARHEIHLQSYHRP